MALGVLDCTPVKVDGEPFMVSLLDAVKNMVFLFSDRSTPFFFFFIFFPPPPDLMFLLSFKFLKIGSTALLWLPVQLRSRFLIPLMQFGFPMRCDKASAWHAA